MKLLPSSQLSMPKPLVSHMTEEKAPLDLIRSITSDFDKENL
jgi:hypothetical protein